MQNIKSSPRAPEHLETGKFIDIFLTYRWSIISIVISSLLIGSIVAVFRTPVYKADALVQLGESDKVAPTVIKDFNPPPTSANEVLPISAEIEIMSSRGVLEKVVDKLHLNILVHPDYSVFTKAGNRILRNSSLTRDGGAQSSTNSSKVLLLKTLDVASYLEDEELILVAGVERRYTLLNSDRVTILVGSVGEKVALNDVVINVEELKANPGTEFKVSRLSSSEAVKRLKESFTASEKSKRSGIIEATLIGSDRESLPAILNEILQAYREQSIARRMQAAEDQLSGLTEQLPSLRAQVQTAESAYNNFRKIHGSVDFTLETEGVLKALADADAERNKLIEDREEMRQRFTAEHPTLQAVESKLALVNRRRDRLNSGVLRFPDIQQTAAGLKRNVEITTSLYLSLLNAIQQLKANKVSAMSDVRIVDAAKVVKLPIAPKKSVIITTALLAGIIGAIALTTLRHATRNVVDSPSHLESAFDVPMLAVIGQRTNQKSRSGSSSKSPVMKAKLLVLQNPDDDAVEDLRHLQTVILSNFEDKNLKSLAVVSSRTGVGKTFLATNLAALFAQSGKRTIVVDCDMRNGQVDQIFGVLRSPGLSDFIQGKCELLNSIQHTEFPNLSLLTSGEKVAYPAQLVARSEMKALLGKLEEAYDVVIIDTPPVLEATDAVLLAKQIGLTLMVTRAGVHPIAELQQTLTKLEKGGVFVAGAVFNCFDVRRQRYRFGNAGHVYASNYLPGSRISG